MIRRKAGLTALRVSKRRAEKNDATRRKVRKAVSAVRKAVAASKVDEAREGLKKVFSELDRAVKSGVVHKRTAARTKSRLASAISKIKKA